MDDERIITELQRLFNEMEADEHGFGAGDTPDYIPGYLNALIDVGNAFGVSFYNETGARMDCAMLERSHHNERLQRTGLHGKTVARHRTPALRAIDRTLPLRDKGWDGDCG